jgi:hypothetical protein
MPPSPTHKTTKLTPRDYQVLIGLFEARVFTLKQLATLFFEDRYETAKKRLQKLKAAGYVRQRPRQPFQPVALVLAKIGFDTIRHMPELARYPEIAWHTFYKRTQIANSTLLHELAVSESRVQLTTAIHQRPDLDLLEFTTWPTLIQFDARTSIERDGLTYRKTSTIRPDGLFRIRQHFPHRPARELHFYLEVDRSTESQSTLHAKALAYQDRYRQSAPFRVLFVLQTIQRMAHTRETFAAIEGRQPFLFTLADHDLISQLVNESLA